MDQFWQQWTIWKLFLNNKTTPSRCRVPSIDGLNIYVPCGRVFSIITVYCVQLLNAEQLHFTDSATRSLWRAISLCQRRDRISTYLKDMGSSGLTLIRTALQKHLIHLQPLAEEGVWYAVTSHYTFTLLAFVPDNSTCSVSKFKGNITSAEHCSCPSAPRDRRLYALSRPCLLGTYRHATGDPTSK
jgi:hypothetical protein